MAKPASFKRGPVPAFHPGWFEAEQALEQQREDEFVGSSRPRKRSGFGDALDALINGGERMRAEIRESVLQLATTMHEVHRIDVAREVAGIGLAKA